MLDLETLGVTNDAVILTLGAVKFDPHSANEPHSPLYFAIDITEQQDKGRIIDPGTVEWWGRQSQEAQDAALGEDNRISMTEAINQLNKFMVGVTDIYCQGPTFDICMLENFYAMVGKSVPWQFWQIRDSRTIFKLVGYDSKKNNVAAHNALADAYSQAIGVQDVVKLLGITKDCLK